MPTLQLTRSRTITFGAPALPSLRGRGRGGRVVGLDIEAGAISAAQVTVDGGLRVERAAWAPLAPGVVRDGEVIDGETLAASLRALFAEHDLDRRVRIGVANQRIVVRPMLLPVIVDPGELRAAVRFQAAAELPMPVDQAVLDQVPLGVVETPDGPRLRVLVVAARRDTIDRLLAATRAAGLRPEGIDLAAFALLRATGLPAEDGAGPVLHLGVGGVVNLALARGRECLFTRVLPGGLEAMALELSERGALTVPEARAQLVAPAAERTEEATGVLGDGIRRVAGEVRTSVDFHLGADEPVSRVVLSGPALAVPGFAADLQERLGLEIIPADVPAAGFDAGRFAVAAGLALQEAPA
jgi:type IV pilus assembly protein PilM